MRLNNVHTQIPALTQTCFSAINDNYDIQKEIRNDLYCNRNEQYCLILVDVKRVQFA